MTATPTGVTVVQDLHGLRIVAPSPNPSPALVALIGAVLLATLAYVAVAGEARAVGVLACAVIVVAAQVLHLRTLELRIVGGALEVRPRLLGLPCGPTCRRDLGGADVTVDGWRVHVVAATGRSFALDVTPEIADWLAEVVREAARTTLPTIPLPPALSAIRELPR